MVKVALCRFQQSLGSFAMFFLKRPLKRHFTEFYLLTFFGDGNLRTTSAMRVIFFFENVQRLMEISKMQRKSEKKTFVSQVKVSELVALNFFYKEENTSHRQSMS